MAQDEPPPLVTVNRYSAVPIEDVELLANALNDLGFRVEQRKHDLEILNVVEWSIPAIFTVAFSGAGALSLIAFKKYMDGFLEELGVKKLGSDTVKGLRRVFDTGAATDAAYYRKLSERVEPRLEQPTPTSLPDADDEAKQKPNNIENDEGGDRRIVPVHPPSLNLDLTLGGNELSNPPWRLQFIFSRDLGSKFDEALSDVGHCLSDFGALRRRWVMSFIAKLRDPERYYGTSLIMADANYNYILNELIELVNITCGTFLFDKPMNTWVKVDSLPGVWSPSEIFRAAFSDGARPAEIRQNS